MEVRTLNEIKSRYRLLTNSVIQDLYDVFRDVTLVEEILAMTFPQSLNQEASQLAQMFSKPKNVGVSHRRGPAAGSDNFWTDSLVRSYMKRVGRPD